MSEHELRGGISSEMDKFVQNQVNSGLFDSRAEYVRNLVRDDMLNRGDVQ